MHWTTRLTKPTGPNKSWEAILTLIVFVAYSFQIPVPWSDQVFVYTLVAIFLVLMVKTIMHLLRFEYERTNEPLPYDDLRPGLYQILDINQIKDSPKSEAVLLPLRPGWSDISYARESVRRIGRWECRYILVNKQGSVDLATLKAGDIILVRREEIPTDFGYHYWPIIQKTNDHCVVG